MRFAVLLVPDFSLQALLRGRPDLAGRPVALTDGEGRKAVVAMASAETRGVEAGMPVALATARRPEIILLARDPDAEVEAQRLLLAAALTLAPRVEATAASCCTVDLQGADADRTRGGIGLCLAELASAGLSARIGAARTPLLAGYAAQRADPVLIAGDERALLDPLPLRCARPSPAQADILAQWGVKTLGQLAALPKAEVGRRLGPEGVALWERAAGETERVLRLVEPPKTFAAEWPYAPPVESLEPLLFHLRRFGERLAFELRASGFVAEELSLTLQLEDGAEHRRKFRLAEPNTEVSGWLRILSAHLQTVRTTARVSGARLVAAPARPQQKQDGLFETSLCDPPAFWENLARLGAIVGDDRVGTPVAADSCRPEAFSLQKPAAVVPPPEEPPVHPPLGPVLRRFRPPWPVRVRLLGGRPADLAGEGWAGSVRSARGPWFAGGDWWKPERWANETWQVELSTGELYQLARSGGEWRVEGILD